ncbi:MAG: bifunctional 5,10-methylenetetrahydrofolate dehydrogenase/5,10-methenyltetrahydrofolate cyclohydrolase [Patescibacteria group bacterium]
MGIIQGNILANKILNELKAGRPPEKWLVLYVVEGDPIAEIFVRKHQKVAAEMGVDLKTYRFFTGTANNETFVASLVNHASQEIVGGILITLPLPKNIDLKKVLKTLPPKKDVGVISQKSVFAPPAVATVETIFTELRIEYKGKTVAIIGRGTLIGAPLAKFFKKEAGRIIWLNSKNFEKRRSELPEADIIISGAGRKNLIGPDDISERAVVIDFGGDVDFEKCKDKTNLITPPRGGVGPILIAHIFKNFYSIGSPR